MSESNQLTTPSPDQGESPPVGQPTRGLTGKLSPRWIWGIFWALTLLVSVGDQLSKQIALTQMVPGQSIPLIPGFFSLTLTFNAGAAFSLFIGGRWLFVGISVAAVWLLPAYLRGFIHVGWRHWLYPLSLGLILGGALGNALDRLFRYEGMVVDFLHFYWGPYSFPVFNLADTAISTGVALLLLVMLLGKRFRGDHASEWDEVADSI